MRRTLTSIVIAVLVMGVGVGSAAAPGDLILSIPVDSVVRADPGTLTEVARLSVDPVDVGQQCELQVEADNNASVHPGNDLIVASGSTEAVLFDVEGDPGQVTLGSGLLTLGPVVTVTLRMGGDAVFSGGFFVDCRVPQIPPPGSTSVPPSSSSSLPPASSSLPPASSSLPPASSSLPPISSTVPTASSVSPSMPSPTTSSAPTTSVTPTVAPPQQTSVPPTSTPGAVNPPAQPAPPSQESPPPTPSPGEPNFVG